MAIPGSVAEQVDPLSGLLDIASQAVDTALGARNTEIENRLVSEVLDDVLGPVEACHEALEALDVALDVAFEENAEFRDDVRACQSALVLIHMALMEDVALLAPFEAHENAMIQDLVGQVFDELPSTTNAIYDLTQNSETNVLDCLRAGADLFEADSVERKKERNMGGLRPDVEREVSDTIRAIVERSASTTTTVVRSLLTHAFHVPGILSRELPDKIRGSMKEIDHGELTELLKRLAGRISRLIGRIFHSVRARIMKILRRDNDRSGTQMAEDVAARVEELANDGIVQSVLKILLGVTGVAAAVAAGDFNDSQSRGYARQLRKLRTTNKRWVGPASKLGEYVGHLWLVAPGGVPLAPFAGALLLIWTVAVSGDHLDSAGPYPDFWPGVVRLAPNYIRGA